jgi:phosphate-selective porin OprO/OprP
MTAAIPATAESGSVQPGSAIWVHESGWQPQIGYADDKVRFEWSDKVQLAFGGLFQGEWGYVEKNAPVNPEGWDSQVRRGRLRGEGLILNHIAFVGEYDFAGDRVRAGEIQKKYKDVYISLVDIPILGEIRLGHFKEPYSLQFLIDAGDRVFMEQALSAAFTPGRNTGVMVRNAFFDDRFSVALGAFANVTDDSDFWGESGQTNFTMRLTGLPWYADGGRKLFHIGGAWSHQWRNDDDTVRYQQKPEYNMALPVGDTGDIFSESQDSIQAEMALNFNSFSTQVEISFPYQNRPGPGNHHFKAAYLQVSYLLTGEHRPYDKKAGAFTRLRPKRPVRYKDFRSSGWGAWEVALRASILDLHNKKFRGGYMNQVGFALNWYLNSNLRLTTNYLYNHLHAQGGTSIWAMRAQIHF